MASRRDLGNQVWSRISMNCTRRIGGTLLELYTLIQYSGYSAPAGRLGCAVAAVVKYTVESR